MAILRDASRTARQREWRAQLRLRGQLETRFQRRLASEFRQVAAAAADGFATGRTEGALLAMRGHEMAIADLTGRHHRATFQVFGTRLQDSVKHFGPLEAKDSEGIFSQGIERWLREFGAQRVVRIAETTRKRILAAILDGEAEGEGVPAIARRIRSKTGGIIAAARSLVIARTETHAAATAADDEMVRALDLDGALEREWIAAGDNRTRDAHIDADGQRRPTDEPFDVDGVAMDRPGDPSAPPHLVIHCRCVLGYHPIDR